MDTLADLKTLSFEEIESRSKGIANMWSLPRIKNY